MRLQNIRIASFAAFRVSLGHRKKSVGFSVKLFYVFLHYFCVKIFTFFYVLRFTSFFFNVLCYCLRKLFYVFYFTFTFTFYLVILRFCKMKIRKRKIVVISFYEILFVNLYFTFTFTLGEFFYVFFFTFSILRFLYEKNILWKKNVNRQPCAQWYSLMF